MSMQHHNQMLAQSLIFQMHSTAKDTILIQKVAVADMMPKQAYIYMYRMLRGSLTFPCPCKVLAFVHTKSYNHLGVDLQGRVKPAFILPSPSLHHFSKNPKEIWALGKTDEFYDSYLKCPWIASTNKLFQKNLCDKFGE